MKKKKTPYSYQKLGFEDVKGYNGVANKSFILD